ncbi:MAG: elongation factor P [Spirochaetota bacterium]|nr:MAG: elongation factor P [Spirochaetota bacterium]
MVSANDLRRGMMIKVENELYSVTGFQWTKPGKGGAFIKARLRNIKKNAIIEKTFRATEKIENIYIEKRRMQYLYSDGESSIFMDLESFEQESISNSFIEEERKFLKEGQEVDVNFYESQIISIELPLFVELKVTHTEPGLRGDTQTATFKPSTLETGAKVQVPLFVNENDLVKIDTRTGEYIERV